MFGAWDRQDAVSLGQDPSQGNLRALDAFLMRDGSDRLDHFEVPGEVLSLKTRVPSPPIIGLQVCFRAQFTGQEPAPKRAIGYELDAKVSACWNHFRLVVAGPQGVFVLQGGDRVDGMCPPQRPHGSFRKSQITHLPFLDQFRHGSHGLFDRGSPVDPVQVIQIDMIRSEAKQTRFARLSNILRRAIDEVRRVGLNQVLVARQRTVIDDAELRRKEDARTAICQYGGEKFFIGPWPVDIRRIPKVHTKFEGPLKHAKGFRVIATSIRIGHAHAAQSDGTNFVGSQSCFPHISTLQPSAKAYGLITDHIGMGRTSAILNPMLSAVNLGKRYGSRWLFRGIEIQLEQGHCLAVLGRNGSGKSTLLKSLVGLVTPSEGKVSIDGAIGYSSIDLAVYPALTATEHLELTADLRQCECRSSELLSQVGLEAPVDQLAMEFSTGMRARLKLAMAIQAEPEVLVLDEPGAGLDEVGRKLVEDVIELQLTTGAVVLATNDPLERRFATHQLEIGS